MSSGPGFSQLILSPPPHYLATKLDETLEHLLEIEDPWLTVNDGQVNHAKGRLHGRQLKQLVEHHLRNRITLQFHHDPHAGSIGFIAQIGNALQLLLVAELGNAFDQTRLVDLKRNLRDYDR